MSLLFPAALGTCLLVASLQIAKGSSSGGKSVRSLSKGICPAAAPTQMSFNIPFAVGISTGYRSVKFEVGVYFVHPVTQFPWSFDIITLDVAPIVLWVSMEETHNCSSIWQNWINFLCCQAESCYFLSLQKRLSVCWTKCQESLKQISPLPQRNSRLWKPGISNQAEQETWGPLRWGELYLLRGPSWFVSLQRTPASIIPTSLDVSFCWALEIMCSCHLSRT